MREQALTAPAHGIDPIGSAADAMGAAVVAVKQGASEVQTRVSESIPAAGHFLSRLIYKSSYVLSFGVVFPVMLLVRAVPKNNALVHGLVDGALAARDAVDGWGEAPPTEDLDHESSAAENGSAMDTKATEPPNHSRRGTKRRSSSHATPKRSSRKS